LIPELSGIDDVDWIIDDADCKICAVDSSTCDGIDDVDWAIDDVDWVIDGDCVNDVVGWNTDGFDDVDCATEDDNTVDCMIDCDTDEIADIVDGSSCDDNVTAEDVCAWVIDTIDNEGDTMTTKTSWWQVSKECDQSEMWWGCYHKPWPKCFHTHHTIHKMPSATTNK